LGLCRDLKDPTPCGFKGGAAWTHPYNRNRGIYDRDHQGCFANYIDPDHFDLLFAFGYHKDGFMPLAGGWAKQPAKYVQAMRLISSEVNRIEEDQMKEREAKAKRRSG